VCPRARGRRHRHDACLCARCPQGPRALGCPISRASRRNKSNTCCNSPTSHSQPHSGVVSRAPLQIEQSALHPGSVSPPVSWKSAAWQHQQQQQQRGVGTRIMRPARALPVSSPSLYALPAAISQRHVTPVPPVSVYSSGGEKLEEAEVEESKGRSRRPWRVH
jgi:hypothetical protein